MIELYEKNALAKLFFNKSIMDKYLPSMLTSIFQNPDRRLAAYSMQLLHSKGASITIESIVMSQSSEKIKSFRWKHYSSSVLTVESLTDMLYDLEVDSSKEQFPEIWRELHSLLWKTKVNDSINSMRSNMSPRNVLPIAKSISKIHNVIYKHKYTTDASQIASAVNKINGSKRVLPFFSDELNKLIGGWTCGYPNAIMGRGGHAKSTFMTYDTIWKIDNNIIDSVDIILCEEDIASFWGRVFAYKFNIPLIAIRNGTIGKITEEQLKMIEKLYSSKIHVYTEIIRYEDVLDIIFSSSAQFIWIDHINGIEFPGRGNTMQNMIGGIPGLIAREKEYLKDRKETVLVNFTQINEKQMAQERTLWKMPKPTDAYGGTTINQAAREVLCVYYPFKDAIMNPNGWVGKYQNKPHQEQDLYVSVGKSNLGRTGEVHLEYDVDHASFKDYVPPEVKKDIKAYEQLTLGGLL